MTHKNLHDLRAFTIIIMDHNALNLFSFRSNIAKLLIFVHEIVDICLLPGMICYGQPAASFGDFGLGPTIWLSFFVLSPSVQSF